MENSLLNSPLTAEINYYRKIDGLRFIAILFVMIEHFASFLAKYISAGYYGVDLFFVISGFLITGILLKPNEGSFKKNYLNFLGRRFLRIFPIYYITLFLLWIINIEDIRQYTFYLFTYSANYGMILKGLPNAPVVHLWSLSVEEQFYLFWPFVVLYFKYKRILLTIVMLGIIVLGYAQIIFNIFPFVTKYNSWGIFPRMASLALGGIGAIISIQKAIPKKLFNNRMFEIIMLLILIAALIIPLFPLKPLFLGLCSLYFVLKASKFDFRIKPLNNFLSNKYIVYIGTISYGVYLFHPILGYFLTTYIFDPVWLNINFTNLGSFKIVQWHSWIIKFPLYSLLAFLIASISFEYIERPILSLKNRWFPHNYKKSVERVFRP